MFDISTLKLQNNFSRNNPQPAEKEAVTCILFSEEDELSDSEPLCAAIDLSDVPALIRLIDSMYKLCNFGWTLFLVIAVV